MRWSKRIEITVFYIYNCTPTLSPLKLAAEDDPDNDKLPLIPPAVQITITTQLPLSSHAMLSCSLADSVGFQLTRQEDALSPLPTVNDIPHSAVTPINAPRPRPYAHDLLFRPLYSFTTGVSIPCGHAVYR